MFDLNECLKEAKKNPKFKQEILKDANQAIEKRYGKKLPYKLTCHSELVFRVKPKVCVKSNDDFLDSDLKSVAGGSPGPNTTLIPFDKDLFFGHNQTIYGAKICLPYPAPGSMGSISYRDVIVPGPHKMSFPKKLGASHYFKLVRGQDGKIYMMQ